MFRIGVVQEAEAEGPVAEVYAQMKQGMGMVPNVIKSLSLWPEALQGYTNLLNTVLFSTSRLSRGTKEMIAAHVSNLNRCGYCVGHHRNFMVQFGVPPETAEGIVENFASASITDAERRLLDYAGQITREAYRVTDGQVEELKEVGWTDTQILEATLVAYLFNDVNRFADALGVQPEMMDESMSR